MAEDHGDPAERAFNEQARALVALKAAVDALRKSKAGPDYAPTLARLTAIMEELKARPTTVTLNSGALGAEVGAAVDAVLTTPLREMQRDGGGGQRRALLPVAERARADRAVPEGSKYWWGAAGVAGEAVIWVVVSGPLARNMPESWHVPEKMAAATLSENRAAAGQQMSASQDPRGWADTVKALKLYRANRAR